MSEKTNVKHVQVPDPSEFKDLKPTDRLVYANIRRFMNKDTLTCYPSMQTIASKCGISKDTVALSIKRLEKYGYIKILDKKHGKNNIYKFEKLVDNFERFTDQFLDQENLSPNEKAYLIGFQSQCYKTGGFALTSYSNQELADNLNMSISSIKRYNTALKSKEIMTELQTAKCDENGFKKIIKAVELAKIGQQVLFEVAINHEDRIQQLEKTVEILMRENQALKKQLYPETQNSYEFGEAEKGN